MDTRRSKINITSDWTQAKTAVSTLFLRDMVRLSIWAKLGQHDADYERQYPGIDLELKHPRVVAEYHLAKQAHEFRLAIQYLAETAAALDGAIEEFNEEFEGESYAR